MNDSDLAPAAVSHSASKWAPSLGASLLACILGVGVATLLIHGIDPYFKFADLPELGISPSAELVLKHNAAQHAFYSQNLSLDLAVLGLCLGLAVGIITSTQRRIVAGLAGGVAGLVGGALAGYFVGIQVAQAVIISADQSLVQSTLLHFAAWAGILALLMLAVGSVHSGFRSSLDQLLIGLLLAFIVACAFNVLSSAVLTGSNLLMVIPQSLTERLVWLGITSTVLGLSLYFFLKPKPSPSAPVPAAANSN